VILVKDLASVLEEGASFVKSRVDVVLGFDKYKFAI
jgi:hypothetical protein